MGLRLGFAMWVFLWVFWWFHGMGLRLGFFGGVRVEV